jgi:hypothetical protein
MISFDCTTSGSACQSFPAMCVTGWIVVSGTDWTMNFLLWHKIIQTFANERNKWTECLACRICTAASEVEPAKFLFHSNEPASWWCQRGHADARSHVGIWWDRAGWSGPPVIMSAVIFTCSRSLGGGSSGPRRWPARFQRSESISWPAPRSVPSPPMVFSFLFFFPGKYELY